MRLLYSHLLQLGCVMHHAKRRGSRSPHGAYARRDWLPMLCEFMWQLATLNVNCI